MTLIETILLPVMFVTIQLIISDALQLCCTTSLASLSSAVCLPSVCYTDVLWLTVGPMLLLIT